MGCGSSVPTHEDDKVLLEHPSTRDGRMNSKVIKPAAPEAPPANKQPAQQQEPPKSKLPSTATPVNRARDRTDAIKESRAVKCDGIKMRYAYLSQRGHYPDDPFKANQDAYCVQESLREGHEDAFFGVFDGHGQAGDGCAIYTKKNLPKQVKNAMEKAKKKSKKELTKDQVQAALLKSHVETNKGLHRNASIDDSLSGTTAVSMYLHGRRNRITISNVGDSRAVLGQDNGRAANLKALPLSRDQTPYRKDERARIRGTGARILSLDQLEGLEPIVDASENEDFELGEELDEGGDPPRVWHPTGDYPGTALYLHHKQHMRCATVVPVSL